MEDLDGTLTGNVGGVATPNNNLLDKSSCTVQSEWSDGVDTATCDSNVSRYIRYNLKFAGCPSYENLTKNQWCLVKHGIRITLRKPPSQPG